MNERIEKLAFEAGLKWKAQPPHYTNTNNPIDFPVSANRDLEKFAELIVRECVELLRQREEEMWRVGCETNNPNTKTRSDECHIMADYIVEHFGVEE